MADVVLGFRTHSGWAAAVAVGGTATEPEVVRRVRIEMVNGRSPGGKQPYHAAEPRAFPAAEKLIHAAIDSANAIAKDAIGEVVDELKASGHRAIAAAQLGASGRPLPDLKGILSSHPALHSAEGELYRAALDHACAECGIPCERIREKEILAIAAEQFKVSSAELSSRLIELGRSVGKPWTQDEKLATLAAWLVLSNSSQRREKWKSAVGVY